MSDQTLEPTTIAGFAQFFDDFDRTDAWTAAAGADFRVANNVWMGAEYLYRSLEIPAPIEEILPLMARSTAWSAMQMPPWETNLALSAGVQFSDNSTEEFDRPAEVRTLILPVGARYFHPSGFFAAAEAIWVDQSAD